MWVLILMFPVSHGYEVPVHLPGNYISREICHAAGFANLAIIPPNVSIGRYSERPAARPSSFFCAMAPTAEAERAK
jgi:hypothetical protein